MKGTLCTNTFVTCTEKKLLLIYNIKGQVYMSFRVNFSGQSVFFFS